MSHVRITHLAVADQGFSNVGGDSVNNTFYFAVYLSTCTNSCIQALGRVYNIS